MPAPPAPGWVYVLTNPAMPGVVKIDLTTKTPKAHAVELTAATGVPMPFKVEWRYRCTGASIRLYGIRTTSIRPLSVTR